MNMYNLDPINQLLISYIYKLSIKNNTSINAMIIETYYVINN